MSHFEIVLEKAYLHLNRYLEWGEMEAGNLTFLRSPKPIKDRG